MMKTMALTTALTALLLAGCQTTQETSARLRGRWVGQPADAFFVAHGPPVAAFPRDTGGTIYTWRGGEHTSVTPSVVEVRPAQPPATNSAVRSYAPDWWRAQAAGGQPGSVRVQSGRRYDYVCEAHIAANAAGVIESVTISRDTDGVGLSFSRCSEVFGQ